MKTLAPEQIDWLVSVLKYWGGLIPSVKTLIVMIGLDIVSGVLVAIGKKKLNSTTSFTGMCRKTMVLLLVAVAIVLEPYANGMPLSMLVALAFIGMEGISILENAGALGIPIPKVIVEVLEKMRESKTRKMAQKGGDTASALIANIEATQQNTAAIEARTVQAALPTPVIVENPPEHPVIVAVNSPIN